MMTRSTVRSSRVDSRGTLDDGEAATIAFAVGRDGLALIDERKARKDMCCPLP